MEAPVKFRLVRKRINHWLTGFSEGEGRLIETERMLNLGYVDLVGRLE
jgi:hypothetical protein